MNPKSLKKALSLFRDAFIDLNANYDLGKMVYCYRFSDDIIDGFINRARYATGFSRNYCGLPGNFDWFRNTVDQAIGQQIGRSKEQVASSDKDFSTHISNYNGYYRANKANRVEKNNSILLTV